MLFGKKLFFSIAHAVSHELCLHKNRKLLFSVSCRNIAKLVKNIAYTRVAESIVHAVHTCNHNASEELWTQNVIEFIAMILFVMSALTYLVFT